MACYTGTLAITNELTLLNPCYQIRYVHYDWDTNIVDIELYFNENGGVFMHSRTFQYSNPTGGELSSDDIIAYLNADPILGLFT